MSEGSKKFESKRLKTQGFKVRLQVMSLSVS